MEHVIHHRTMVAWHCSCGATWRNDKLKGKTDDDLIDENSKQFSEHVAKMRKAGY